jgi:hypothetical protein
MQIRLKVPHTVTAIGEKDHLLVFLHALRFQQLPKPPVWFFIERLDETEAFAARGCLFIASPKVHDALAGETMKAQSPIRVKCEVDPATRLDSPNDCSRGPEM